MKKMFLKIFPALCLIVLLTSCGTVRNASDEGRRQHGDQVVPADTMEKRDTFVPLHPPVVIPHTWNETGVDGL